MPYIVVVYDMEADRTRYLRKLLRKYLTHVQNSVFEGDVTVGQVDEITDTIEDEIKPATESAIVYELGSESFLSRSAYGDDPSEDSRFL